MGGKGRHFGAHVPADNTTIVASEGRGWVHILVVLRKGSRACNCGVTVRHSTLFCIRATASRELVLAALCFENPGARPWGHKSQSHLQFANGHHGGPTI